MKNEAAAVGLLTIFAAVVRYVFWAQDGGGIVREIDAVQRT